MNRIVVIGPLGGGKSTLRRRLSEIIGVPIVKLDDIRMKDEGHPVPHDEWK
jgi:adenylate kinase family enzyme